MRLKLNKKYYQIKPASELTVKEYLQLIQIDYEGNIDFVLSYLSITLNMKFTEVLKYKLDNLTLSKILTFIGIIEPYGKIIKKELPRSFYFEGTIKKVKDMDIYPVGVRWLMESKTDLNNVEHSVYLLSILLLDQFDRDKAEDNYNSLLGLNYLRVLPLAAFFLNNLQIITSKGKRFSLTQIKAFIINTLRKLTK